MKLTKKQRIALEFLAEVGPIDPATLNEIDLLKTLLSRNLVTYNQLSDDWRITRKGREALKETQK